MLSLFLGANLFVLGVGSPAVLPSTPLHLHPLTTGATCYGSRYYYCHYVSTYSFLKIWWVFHRPELKLQRRWNTWEPPTKNTFCGGFAWHDHDIHDSPRDTIANKYPPQRSWRCPKSVKENDPPQNNPILGVSSIQSWNFPLSVSRSSGKSQFIHRISKPAKKHTGWWFHFFLFSSLFGVSWSILTIIFFRWVGSTTN